MNIRDLMIGTTLALALGACGGKSAAEADLAEIEASMEQDQAPVAGEPASVAPAAKPAADAVAPVVLSTDAVVVGSSVAATGAVDAPKAVFATGDTVYVSVATAGRPAGAEVVVFWFGPDGSSVKEERKSVGAGASYVSFTLGRSDGMTAGAFTVQVDVAGQPVGMADFSVR